MTTVNIMEYVLKQLNWTCTFANICQCKLEYTEQIVLQLSFCHLRF